MDSRMQLFRFFLLLLHLSSWTLVLPTVATTDIDDDQTVLRWASSGGGWRSMIVNIGYANAFQQAGIILDDSTTGNSSSSSKCHFSAISSNSGASWFLLQFAYSRPFQTAVLSSNVDTVRSLMTGWMDSVEGYYRSLPTAPKDSFFITVLCSFLSVLGYLLPFVRDVAHACHLFTSNPTFGDFIRKMFRAASETYGDTDLVETSLVDIDNMLLNQTDIYIQLSLAPNSRYRDASSWVARLLRPDSVSYVGTTSSAGSESDQSSDERTGNLLAIPLATQFAVKQQRQTIGTIATTQFNYAVPDHALPLTTRTSPGPWRFKYQDWEPFYLYDGPSVSGNVYANKDVDYDVATTAPFAEPFAGRPNLVQIAAASSANLADLSGRAPSFFAQRDSVAKYDAVDSNDLFTRLSSNLLGSFLFNFGVIQDLSICSQWPDPCGPSDGRLLDGGFSDGPSLAMNIGQYHTVNQGDLNKTMKVILTNNNFYGDSNVKFLSYFQTTFNEDVAPGAFIWAPFTIPDSLTAQPNPWRSMQIFAQYLDDESMLAAFEEIPGTNLTTAIYNVTTIDNRAFGVKAGQRVEILLLQINSNIPTNLLFPSVLRQWKGPLVDLAVEILESTELVDRIRNFVAR